MRLQKLVESYFGIVFKLTNFIQQLDRVEQLNAQVKTIYFLKIEQTLKSVFHQKNRQFHAI